MTAGTRGRWGSLGTVAAATALLAGACAQEVERAAEPDVEAASPEDFAATPEYLRTLASRTADEPFRFEMWMSFGDDVDTSQPPLLTGEQEGDMAHGRFDFGRLMEAAGTSAPPGMDDVDMTTEVVVDPPSTYMRMPFITELAPSNPRSEQADLMEAFEGWVHVDQSQVPTTELESIQDITGGQDFDPSLYLDVLAQAEGASELEPTDVRGELMVGLQAEVELADLAAAQGTDAGELEESLSDEHLVDALHSPVDMSVWVDSEGRVGRLSYTHDVSAVLEAHLDEASDAERSAVERVFSDPAISIVLDLFDYGDPGIEVQIPEDATDLTDDFVRHAGGAPAGSSTPGADGNPGSEASDPPSTPVPPAPPATTPTTVAPPSPPPTPPPPPAPAPEPYDDSQLCEDLRELNQMYEDMGLDIEPHDVSMCG